MAMSGRLRALKKDDTAPDFTSAEGTLGIITKAC